MTTNALFVASPLSMQHKEKEHSRTELCAALERHVFPRTVVSMRLLDILHNKYPTNLIGLVQSGYRFHLIECNLNAYIYNFSVKYQAYKHKKTEKDRN